jgi:hypothetical protein
MADSNAMVTITTVIVAIVAIVAIVVAAFAYSRICDYHNAFKSGSKWYDLVSVTEWDEGVGGGDSGDKRVDDVRKMFMATVVLNFFLAVPVGFALYTLGAPVAVGYGILALLLVIWWTMVWYYIGKIGNNDVLNGGEVEPDAGSTGLVDVNHPLMSVASLNVLGMVLHSFFAIAAVVYIYRSRSTLKSVKGGVDNYLSVTRNDTESRAEFWNKELAKHSKRF